MKIRLPCAGSLLVWGSISFSSLHPWIRLYYRWPLVLWAHPCMSALLIILNVPSSWPFVVQFLLPGFMLFSGVFTLIWVLSSYIHERTAPGPFTMSYSRPCRVDINFKIKFCTHLLKQLLLPQYLSSIVFWKVTDNVKFI